MFDSILHGKLAAGDLTYVLSTPPPSIGFHQNLSASLRIHHNGSVVPSSVEGFHGTAMARGFPVHQCLVAKRSQSKSLANLFIHLLQGITLRIHNVRPGLDHILKGLGMLLEFFMLPVAHKEVGENLRVRFPRSGPVSKSSFLN